MRALSPRTARAASACVLLLLCGRALAQDALVDAHGWYYKETSTRVVQPRIDVAAVVPKYGTVVDASYALDAITSASLSAGVGRDTALTEYRNEAGFSVTQPAGPTRASLYYSRSRESDYDSDTVGTQLSLDLFERNTTWSVGYAHSFDKVYNRPQEMFRGDANTDFASLSVAQILSPTTVGVLGFEYARPYGMLANVYRNVNVASNPMLEQLPSSRNRYTLSGRIAQLFPSTATTVALIARFYTDDWDLTAGTVEARVYQDLGPYFDARVAYRYHNQGHAFFALPSYPMGAQLYTSDPKLFAFDSHYFELQGRFHMIGFHGIPVLDWFEAGTLDLTVGTLYMGSTFGNCGPTDPTHECADHVVSLGMTLPL
jgi:hypothetical protein